MPLTPYQVDVAHVLSGHRHLDSYLAGGAVLNRESGSFRYSNDLDIFHDSAARVAVCAEEDAKALGSAGHSVEWTLRQEGFFRAVARRGEESLRLDWTNDSSFRFFPVMADEVFGFCLHPADLAINKVLAIAGRAEIRDFLDILYLDAGYLSFGALAWAACGKDAGYTPSLLLDMANRHVSYQESDLLGESLVRPLDLKDLKKRWLDIRERAENLWQRLPEDEIGCLYLNAEKQPIEPDPDAVNFATLTRHRGSIRDAWPQIS
jgi:hypothetical protein